MSIPALIAVTTSEVVLAGDLVDALPVGDDEAVEAQLALEHIGQQVPVAVHLLAVPTAEGDHDGLRAGVDGGLVRRQVHRTQRRFVDLGVALVEQVGVTHVHGGRGAPGRAAVGEEVLGRSQNRRRIVKRQ